MGRILRLTVIFTLIATQWGCSGDGSRSDAETTEPTAPPSSSPASATPSGPTTPPVAETTYDWQAVAEWSRADPPTNGEYADGYVAYWDAHLLETPQWTRVYDSEDRLIVERVSDAPDWFTQQVWLTEHFAVVEDINDQARTVRLSVFDLETGDEVALDGIEAPTQPEVDAGFGRLMFTTGSLETGMCANVIDLDSLRPDDSPACAPPGDIIGDVAVGETSSTYSRLDNPNRPGSRCKTVVVDSDNGTSELPLRRQCLGWSGAVTEGSAAWDEMDPSSPRLGSAKAYIAHDGEVSPVGTIETESIIGCGDRFFWQAQSGRGARIDSWSAKNGIETVWGPELDVVTTALECTDGRWLHMGPEDITGVDEKLRFVVLDTQTLE